MWVKSDVKRFPILDIELLTTSNDLSTVGITTLVYKTGMMRVRRRLIVLVS